MQKKVSEITLDLLKGRNELLDANSNPLYISSSVLPYQVLTQKYQYRDYYTEGRNIKIMENILIKNYDSVVNFQYIEYIKSLKSFKNYTQVYKSKKYDYLISVDIDLSIQYTEEVENIQKGVYKLLTIYYPSENKGECEGMVKEINKCFIFESYTSSEITIVLKTTGGFLFKQHTIKPLSLDINKMYNDSFKDVNNHIIKNLKNGKKGIIMLHGDAGTGKSNYIKHLTTEVPEKRFVFIPVGMISSLTDPSFLGELITNKGSILILEDCENYIEDRESAGGNNVVSSILNISDGILSDVLELQIICTFNTKLDNIDKALLRKGRLIDQYKFDRLDAVKTENLLKDLNIDASKVDNKEMTLAEIYNYTDDSHREGGRKKIGF